MVLSRRDFIAGGVAMIALVGSATLAGCSSGEFSPCKMWIEVPADAGEWTLVDDARPNLVMEDGYPVEDDGCVVWSFVSIEPGHAKIRLDLDGTDDFGYEFRVDQSGRIEQIGYTGDGRFIDAAVVDGRERWLRA